MYSLTKDYTNFMLIQRYLQRTIRVFSVFRICMCMYSVRSSQANEKNLYIFISWIFSFDSFYSHARTPKTNTHIDVWSTEKKEKILSNRFFSCVSSRFIIILIGDTPKNFCWLSRRALFLACSNTHLDDVDSDLFALKYEKLYKYIFLGKYYVYFSCNWNYNREKNLMWEKNVAKKGTHNVRASALSRK